jgi:hypothetical protein
MTISIVIKVAKNRSLFNFKFCRLLFPLTINIRKFPSHANVPNFYITATESFVCNCVFLVVECTSMIVFKAVCKKSVRSFMHDRYVLSLYFTAKKSAGNQNKTHNAQKNYGTMNGATSARAGTDGQQKFNSSTVAGTKSNHFDKRIGFHFIANSGSIAMARINNYIFVQGVQFGFNTLFQSSKISTGQVCPSYTAIKQHIATN